MPTAYFRSRFHLSRPQITASLLVCSLLVSQLAVAQGYIRKHQEHYEDKIIHYGFFFAAPSTHYNVRHSDAFMTQDSASRIYSPNSTGFRVGFVVNTFLTPRFDLRITPAVSIYSRGVNYDYPNGTQLTEVRESTWLEIPVLLKFKSERRINSRMYMIAGVTFGLETNVRKGAQGTGRLSTNTSDLTLDYGIGFEQFLEFVKFAPELRFSTGLVNVFQPTNSQTSVGIKSLTTSTITLYLTFE